MNFRLLFPELTAMGVLVLLLVREIISPPPSILPRNAGEEKGGGIIGGAVLTLASIFPLIGKNGSAFSGSFILDPLAIFFKIFFLGILIVLIFLSREYFSAKGGPASGGKAHKENASEFLLILWSSLLGLFLMASANDFLLMFIALETFTLSLYVMAAFLKKDLLSIEAGLKYLILGSLASAFVIYSISLIFVATGSTSFLALRDALHANPQNKFIFLALLLMIAGLGFKIAAVPFQLWVADVYEGAPTPVVAYLSVASKSAGFLLLLRVLFITGGARSIDFTILFAVLSTLTLFYGNLGALLQTNIKRLFGYSSISHAAYLLMGLAVSSQLGVSAILYYLVASAFANLISFMVITMVGKATGSDQIEAYRGLGKRSPFLAGFFFLALLSLAGVPPLAGFFGKFLILMAVVKGNILWLALLGALFVAVSLYYYLSLVRVMYFDPASDESPIAVPGSSKFILIILAVGIVAAGLWQAPLFAIIETAARSLF